MYTTERVLPVCDKPYHMNNGFQQMWAEIKNLWNYAYMYSNFVTFHTCNRTRVNCLYEYSWFCELDKLSMFVVSYNTFKVISSNYLFYYYLFILSCITYLFVKLYTIPYDIIYYEHVSLHLTEKKNMSEINMMFQKTVVVYLKLNV